MTNSISLKNDILEFNEITVQFGDFTALDHVSISFEPGKIHAVVGQNGAGKTTFARVASGIIKPSHGDLIIRGQKISSGNVALARKAGIEFVHQSFALPPSFTVAEAMEFGATNHSPFYSKSQLHKRWSTHLKSLDVNASLDARIRDLPIETQQGVEIARALASGNASILLLDEPTAVLSPSGIIKLFERVNILKQRDVTVILILHKLHEIIQIADTISVLRNGVLVDACLDAKNINTSLLTEHIIGPDNASNQNKPTVPINQNTNQSIIQSDLNPIIVIENISTKKETESSALFNLSNKIYSGEIVGIVGVEGNGQKALVECIFGLRSITTGKIQFQDKDISNTTPGARRKLGLRVIPFERNIEGLSLKSSLWENSVINKIIQTSLFSYLNPNVLKSLSCDNLKRWQVKFESVMQNAGSLSGGNAQKLIFSRELDNATKLIVAAQPTRGLDIGATNFVWKALNDAKQRGCTIILISSDLDEIYDIADRIIVMLSGRIVGEFSKPWDKAAIGAAMIGAIP